MNENNIVVSREIMIAALRYSLGRETYMSVRVMEAIKNNIERLSTSDLKLYVEEIKMAHHYGDSFDERAWTHFADYLNEQIGLREE